MDMDIEFDGRSWGQRWLLRWRPLPDSQFSDVSNDEIVAASKDLAKGGQGGQGHGVALGAWDLVITDN